MSDFMYYFDRCRTVREQMRIDAIWDLITNPKENLQQLAEDRFTSTRSIRRWVKLFNKEGFAGLVKLNSRLGRKPIVSDSLWNQKISPLINSSKNPVDGSLNVKALHQRVTQELSIKISRTTLAKTLRARCVRLEPRINANEAGISYWQQIFQKIAEAKLSPAEKETQA